MALDRPRYRRLFYASAVLNVIVCSLAGLYFWGRVHDDKRPQEELTWLNQSRRSLFNLLPGQDGEIIFMGASIIQHCEWAELFSGPKIRNRGISGDTTGDVVKRLSEVARDRPAKLFIMVGLNDLFRKIPINETLNNYLEIVRYMAEHAPDAQVYFFSVLPVGEQHDRLGKMNYRIGTLNVNLKEICKKEPCIFIDLCPFFMNERGFLRGELTHDGIHLNGAGYALWRSVMPESSGL